MLASKLGKLESLRMFEEISHVLVSDQDSRSLGKSHDEVNQPVLKDMIVRYLKGELDNSFPQTPGEENRRRHEGVRVSQVLIGGQHPVQSLRRHFRRDHLSRKVHRDLFSNAVDKWLILTSVEGESNRLVSGVLSFVIVAEENHESDVDQEGKEPDVAGRQTDGDHLAKELNDVKASDCNRPGNEPP